MNLLAIVMFGVWCLCMTPGCHSDDNTRPAPPVNSTATSTNALVQSCLLCHGTREMQRGPVIDGLPGWYIRNQLEKFMSGVRGQNITNRSEHLMGSGISLIQSGSDLETVVVLFSERPPQSHLKTIRGDAEHGGEVYALCATCHGIDGAGREDIKSPPLTVQEDWYLYDQLVRFKSGLRGGSIEDTEGYLMHQAVLGLNTQDFRDVVSYVNDVLSQRGTNAAPVIQP